MRNRAGTWSREEAVGPNQWQAMLREQGSVPANKLSIGASNATGRSSRTSWRYRRTCLFQPKGCAAGPYRGHRDKVIERLLVIEKDLQVAREEFALFLKQVAAEFAKAPEGGDKIANLKNMETMQEELRTLGPGVVLVYTIVGQDKFRELLVTADICKSYEVKAGQAEVNRKVMEFRKAVQDPSLDPRPAGKALHDIVVSPLLRADLVALKAKTVMWSLDGTLRYAPLNAMWDGQHYLVESLNNPVFTIATQGSLARAPSPNWKVAALGVSKAWPGFSALPGVPRELEAIVQTAQNRAGALPGKVELDLGFTENSLPRAVLSRNPVLHIASHFNFQPGDDSQSFLLLGGGNKLTVAKMTRLDFEGVDLLTLSACDTANGSSGEGKEIESFAMLAQRQKARAVVATLWPVGDASTPVLMAEFYKKRNAGMSKIEALQTAQRGLLEGNLGATVAASGTRSTSRAVSGSSQTSFTAPAGRPYAHPFYWAPFILVGNWK